MTGVGTRLRSLLLAAALALVLPGAGLAAGAPDELDGGPAVGAPMPHALAAADQTGKAQDFRSLRGKKGLIVLFNRSFEW